MKSVLHFRCYYRNGKEINTCDHIQEIDINDIPKWIDAYSFTHPNCESITVKIWLKEENNNANKA